MTRPAVALAWAVTRAAAFGASSQLRGRVSNPHILIQGQVSYRLDDLAMSPASTHLSRPIEQAITGGKGSLGDPDQSNQGDDRK